jgi:O-antigen/teichoic acid export membrane protein
MVNEQNALEKRPALPKLDSEAELEANAQGGAGHRVVRNSTLNLIAQGVYAVAYLASIVTMSRALGKEGFGAFFKVFVFVLIIQFFVEAGIATVLTRHIAHAPRVWRNTVAEAVAVFTVVIAATLVVFLFVGYAIAAWNHDPSAMVRLACAGVACAAIQAHRLGAAVFFAFERFSPDNIMKILQGILFAGSLVVFQALGLLTVEWALALLAVSHLAGAAYMLLGLQQQRHCLAAWSLNASVLKTWLGEGVPLGLSDAMRGLSLQLDTILLALLKSDAVVGLYSMASRPIGPLNWLPRAVLTAVFPSLVRQVGGDRAILNRTFGSSIRLLWIVGLPIAVGLSICSETVVVLIGTEEYREAARPLSLIIWIVCLSYVSFQYRFLFTALKRSRLYVALVGFVLCLQTVIDLALIPAWSYYGACAGTLVAEFTFAVGGLILCRWVGIGGIEWSAMARACLAAAGMAAVLWPFRDSPLPVLIPTAGVATVFYFLLCVLLGALPWHEVQHLLATFRRRQPSA